MAARRLKNVVVNSLLFFGSLVFLVLIFEGVVFRYILKASDFPEIETINQIIKYKPDQSGVSRLQGGITARYRINTAGWNSGHAGYCQARSPQKRRIAIIGDSYIEGFTVDYTRSAAEQLEQLLGPEFFEVYRFGIGGAPMSQYLNMLRREVAPYRPDLVVVNLVHNDFDESYMPSGGLYDSYFLKLEIGQGKVLREIPPRPYSRRWYTPIRYSATWRYLHLRRGVRFQFVKDLLLGKKAGKYEANIDVSQLDARKRDTAAACDYIFMKMKDFCQTHQMLLLLVMDGDRGLIYAHPEDPIDYDSRALSLNRLARTTARRYQIPFIDMHPVMAETFRRNRQRFDFEKEGHWNLLGHHLLATQIYQYIDRNKGPLFKEPVSKRFSLVKIKAGDPAVGGINKGIHSVF